jgi:FtsZ-interacting cell division protein ZipA
MSELQISLIGLGVLLVAAVWGYNFWQERKQQRSVEAAFSAAQPDVLMAGRNEPNEQRNEPELDRSAVLREPTFGENVPAEKDVEPPIEDSRAVVALPAEWADARADCLLRIEFVDAVPAASLWAEQAGWSQTLDKPLQWFALDERNGRWHTLLPQDPGTVAQVAVALQLVDRNGPLSEAMLTTFLGGVHQLAQRFSGLVELPEQAPVLARARELDAFCAAVDLQLALHVVPRQGSLNEMIGAKLKPVIDAAGLKLEGERFVAMDAAGAEAFALTCHAATEFSAAQIEAQALTALSFSLDVPRVADGVAAFERMIDFARQCAEALGGQLTDPQHKPLADAAISAIRSRIYELQAQMAKQDIPAGGVRALRLFS